MRRIVAWLLLVPLPLLAQGEDAPTAERSSARIFPAFGVHYGMPLRASAAVGILLDVDNRRNDGMIAMVEVGRQGEEVSAGYFRILSKFGTGFSVRGAVIRTGDDPWNASPSTTYVGGEVQWMLVFGVGGRAGYLRRASRSEADPHENITSLRLSIGF